jgi:hypothetical protein
MIAEIDNPGTGSGGPAKPSVMTITMTPTASTDGALLLRRVAGSPSVRCVTPVDRPVRDGAADGCSRWRIRAPHPADPPELRARVAEAADRMRQLYR